MRKLFYLSVAALAALLVSCEEQPALRQAPVMAPVDADALVAAHPEYLDGMGKAVENPDDISSWCRTSQVPMGANVHFVFYRNNAGDILFKVVHNGKEATLPLETENWPYYSWNAFKAQFAE